MSEQQTAPAPVGAVYLKGSRSVRDLGKRLRDEKDRPTDRDALAEWRAFNCSDFDDQHRRIRDAVSGTPSLMACRIKRLDTIVRKLRRQRTMTLERMDDLVGFRVLVDSPGTQTAAVERIAASLDGELRIKDYVTDPQESGYRAVHLILRRPMQLPSADTGSSFSFEIQVRTWYQHLWSSTSESFGEQVKEGGGSQAVRDYLAELATQLRDREEVAPDEPQVSYGSQAGSMEFFAVQFDRSDALLRCDSLGGDVGKALASYGYLETAGRKTFAREVALLGVASDADALRQTHLRYFSPGGQPVLPEGVAVRPVDTWT